MLLCALSLHRGAFDRGGGLVSGCDAANLLLGISAGAFKRLRLFPEQTEGGQELPSERDANGGVLR